MERGKIRRPPRGSCGGGAGFASAEVPDFDPAPPPQDATSTTTRTRVVAPVAATSLRRRGTCPGVMCESWRNDPVACAAVPVDVLTETEIRRPRAEVAAFAADPDNATAWYKNIASVEWETEPPLAVGSRVRFVARFLGRTLEYTYEVREHDPGR